MCRCRRQSRWQSSRTPKNSLPLLMRSLRFRQQEAYADVSRQDSHRLDRARGLIPTRAVRLDPIPLTSRSHSLHLYHTPKIHMSAASLREPAVHAPTGPYTGFTHPPDQSPPPPPPPRSEAERSLGADPPRKPAGAAPYKYPTSPAPATFENSPSPPRRPPFPSPDTYHYHCSATTAASTAIAATGAETLARMSQQEPADPTVAEEQPGGLSRSSSASRLNAQAPEFVPRATPPTAPPQPVIRVFAAAPPPPPAAFFAAGPPPPPPPFEYYAAVGGGGGGAGFGAVSEHEVVAEQAVPPPAQAQQQGREVTSDDVVHKITKQVEYYFSDINLATTEHLMRFITKDPEGYVPISVVSSFKKIKALVQSNSMLASALQTSSKLVVSEDGNRVKRVQPFTESDLEELQARIVVAENLPDDHCYQNLMKIFSAVGSVRTIRTCYPQTPNGTGPVTNRSAKLDMLFANKLHAFVEYDTIEDAEKAIVVLNDERNWRSGLRVRLLNTCMAKGGKGKKGGHETDGHGEEDVSTSDQPNENHPEETSQPSDALGEQVPEESTGDMGRGRGRSRGRGGRGRGRGHHNNSQYHHNNHQQHHHQNSNHQGNNRGGAHPVGTPPSSQAVKTEQQQTPPIAGANKLHPGPRMPDGTRGFTMGRGKPQISTPIMSASEP